MSDITMCVNQDCPYKETCYRWTAEPDKWQSYSKFDWNDSHKIGQSCYWPKDGKKL